MTNRLLVGWVAGRDRQTKSFTLVELLVAIAILSIIVIVLLGMTTSLMNAWQLGQAKNERRTAGQAALERISRDLRQVALPSSRYNTNGLEFIINPSTVSTNYQFPQAIFWQAPVATDGASSGTAGNMAVVGYFIQWVTNGASYSPCLSRVLVNPTSTSYYSIYSNPTSWITDSIIQNNSPATAASGYVGLMADDVLGLWVQALDLQGNPIQQGANLRGEAFDSRLSYAYTNSIYTNSGIPALATNVAPAMPSSLQIAIIVIDSHTARHLTGTEKPTNNILTGNFWGDIQTFYASLPPIIQKGAEIQTTTVDLVNGPR